MSDQEDLINQFVDITGVTADRAKFYLEAANFTLEVALSGFYEEEQEMDAAEPVPEDDVDPEPEMLPEPRSQTHKSKKSKPKSTDRFATLQSLKDNSSSDEDEEQGQAFYAGGSERSGQQVLGPPKKKPVNDYVSEVFRSAQQGGIETFDPEGRGQSSGSRLYGGTGYRLGETDTDHVAIPTATSASSSRSSFSAQEQEVVNLRLWREGFSINDGDLRLYADPQNREFFECIKRGEIPTELQKKSPGVIHVNLEDHRHEDFVKQIPKFKTFQGQGCVLGSPVPNVLVSPTSQTVSSNNSSTTAVDNEQRALEQLNVNADQPTAMLQIRLSDGSRLSTRFNLTHTIENVRQYITTARPQYSNQNFALLTTFPSKELADGSQTIENAGIANSTVMQRLK